MAERRVWSLFHSLMSRVTPSHLVRIGHDAGFQRDDRVGNLEGRCRKHCLAGARIVAGNHMLAVGAECGKRAGYALIGKMLLEVLAYLVARHAGGERMNGNDSGGSNQRKDMTTGEQVRLLISRSAQHCRRSWPKCG
jgi:hypothetical protein